jgi:hypothetical protein
MFSVSRGLAFGNPILEVLKIVNLWAIKAREALRLVEEDEYQAKSRCHASVPLGTTSDIDEDIFTRNCAYQVPSNHSEYWIGRNQFQ